MKKEIGKKNIKFDQHLIKLNKNDNDKFVGLGKEILRG